MDHDVAVGTEPLLRSAGPDLYAQYYITKLVCGNYGESVSIGSS